MRFRLTQTSNRSAEDNDTEQPSPPFLEGAEVVKRAEWAYPAAVQYIEIASLEDLLALVEKHGRFVLHPTEQEESDIERLPILERYDTRRE